MKAITLWEPWASAMALGVKQIETRGWPTRYRGDLVICSAKREMRPEDYRLVELFGGGVGTWRPSYGFALCVVHLHHCIETTSPLLDYMVPVKLRGAEYLLGNYARGRFAWITDHRRPLKTSVPVRGRQGLFNLDEATEFCIRAQIP